MKRPVSLSLERLRGVAGDPDQFVRFLAVGVVNTVVGYLIYVAALALGASPQVAVAVQFTLGVLWNFYSHKRFVFQTAGSGRLPWYIGAYGLAFVANVLLLNGLLALGFGPLAAQAIAMPPIVVLTYWLVSRALGTGGATVEGDVR